MVWWLLFSSADDKMDGAIAVLTGCESSAEFIQ